MWCAFLLRREEPAPGVTVVCERPAEQLRQRLRSSRKVYAKWYEGCAGAAARAGGGGAVSRLGRRRPNLVLEVYGVSADGFMSPLATDADIRQFLATGGQHQNGAFLAYERCPLGRGVPGVIFRYKAVAAARGQAGRTPPSTESGVKSTQPRSPEQKSPDSAFDDDSIFCRDGAAAAAGGRFVFDRSAVSEANSVIKWGVISGGSGGSSPHVFSAGPGPLDEGDATETASAGVSDLEGGEYDEEEEAADELLAQSILHPEGVCEGGCEMCGRTAAAAGGGGGPGGGRRNSSSSSLCTAACSEDEVVRLRRMRQSAASQAAKAADAPPAAAPRSGSDRLRLLLAPPEQALRRVAERPRKLVAALMRRLPEIRALLRDGCYSPLYIKRQLLELGSVLRRTVANGFGNI